MHARSYVCVYVCTRLFIYNVLREDFALFYDLRILQMQICYNSVLRSVMLEK